MKSKLLIWMLAFMVLVTGVAAINFTAYSKLTPYVAYWQASPCFSIDNITGNYTIAPLEQVRIVVAPIFLASSIIPAECGIPSYCWGDWLFTYPQAKVINYYNEIGFENESNWTTMTLNPPSHDNYSQANNWNCDFWSGSLTSYAAIIADNGGCPYYFQIQEYLYNISTGIPGNHQLKIYIRSWNDTLIEEQDLDMKVITINYTVDASLAVNGSECTYDWLGGVSQPINPNVAENAIQTSLGSNAWIYWIMIMSAVGLFIMFVGGKFGASATNIKLVTLVIVEILMVIIGTSLGFVNWIILAILVFLIAGWIAMKIKDLFT